MWASGKSWLGIIHGKAVPIAGAKIISAKIIGAWVISTGLILSPASAQTDPNADRIIPVAPLEESEQAEVLKTIEDYFSTVSTLSARFRQLNMDGSIYTGDIKINRPGKLRIDYDDPIPYLIVADGLFYIFVDEKLEQASHIPLGLTPANMLLRQPMKLGEEVIVIDAVRDRGLLYATVAQKEAPDAGTLTLAFREEPMTLIQWTVIDAQGIITRVILDNPKRDVVFDDDLFYFINPWSSRPEN